MSAPLRDSRAPDGGWGYLVLLGMVFCFITTFGEMSCLGLMFSDFLASLQLHTSALTALPSCYYMASSLVGVFANHFFSRYSVRTVGLFGAALFVLGSFAVIFVRSLNELLIAYGLLQGTGFGIMLAVCYTTFNRYFVLRRVPMMGLAQTLLGLGNMALPIVIEWWHSEFGFRGCMAMVAALNAHVLVGMLVMHPVEWHQRRGGEDDEGGKELKEEALLPEKQDSQTSPCNNTIWQQVVRFLDLGLCSDPVYVNIAIGVALTLYSDVSYFTILPVYLRELGFAKMATAQVISLCAAADLGARFFLTLASYALQVRARTIFLAGVLGTMATRMLFQHCTGQLEVMAVAAAMGFFRAWIHVPIAIVFAEHLPAERFPSGYGLFMVLQGAVIFVMGPIVGAVRDGTGSYLVTFAFLTLVLAACAIPWMAEMVVVGMRERRRSGEKRREEVETE